MDEIPQKKKNWQIIVLVVITTLLQLWFIMGGILGVFVNGIDTHVAALETTGIYFFIAAALIPIPFWLIAKMKGKGMSFILNLGISFIILLYLGLSLLPQPTAEQQAANQATQDTQIAQGNYAAIAKNLQGRKIVSWEYSHEIPPQNTYILQTDHDWSIHLDVQYNAAVVDYINKNIIGNTFDVILPPYVSATDPIYFSANPVCNCDLLVNGQPLKPVLEKIYQDTQPQ